MLTLWKVTRAAFDATSRLLLAQLRGDGQTGDDTNAAPTDDQPFYQQVGLAALPVVTATLNAIGVELGDEVAVLKLWDKARTPTDLAVGETRVYACGDLTVRTRHTTDGILLNDGTLKVARVTDPVRVGRLTGTTAAGGGPVTFTFVPLDADGVPGTPVVGAQVTITGVISSAGGAPRVKA